MSRPLLKNTEEKEFRRLQAHLVNTSNKADTDSVELTKKDAANLANLLSSILLEKPLVVDSYLTPNEAANLAGVSRPLLIEMLKSGALIGHTVGKHWRIKRESLIEYITNRDKASRLTQELDEEGLSFDL
jgi:excisionase family DNA binding protein